MSRLVLPSNTGSDGPRASSARKLRPPTVLTNFNGSRSFVWVLPVPIEVARRFLDILAEEAQVYGTVKVVDAEDVIVNADYPEDRANFVVFACWLFNRFYTDYQTLTRAHELDCADKPEATHG